MTKAEVISQICDKTGIERADVTESVERFLEVVKEAMSKGENVYIRGFGSFVNKKRAPKIARNILANKTILVPAHFAPTFKPSDVFIDSVKDSPFLKDLINNPAATEKKAKGKKDADNED